MSLHQFPSINLHGRHSSIVRLNLVFFSEYLSHHPSRNSFAWVLLVCFNSILGFYVIKCLNMLIEHFPRVIYIGLFFPCYLVLL